MILTSEKQIDISKIKIIAFDLDGTLTQHRTPLDERNRAVLDKLSQKYRILMVGAGMCMRIFNQMGGYPIDILGNYGLQYSKFNAFARVLGKAVLFAECFDSRGNAFALTGKNGVADKLKFSGLTVEF